VTGFDDADAGRSVARYLGLTMREVGEPIPGRAALVGEAPAAGYLRGPDGGIAMGALLALADSVGGLCGGLAALPGWVVSTNLMLRAVTREVVGPIGLASTVLRVGTKATVTNITITDRGADDALVADGALTSAVLQPENGPPVYQRPLVLATAPLDPTSAPHLNEFLGATASGPRTMTLVITDALRNPWGILHGGVTAALVDLAGGHATGGTATTDTVLHFVSPGRVGPVAATVTHRGTRPDGHLLRIEVRDAGADERLMAMAVTTVR
jgi:acyl-coenzyme A thioesterase PaaI-like protein